MSDTLRLPLTGPWLLAPMEGVTDACFRDLVLARNAPEDLGGATTEFVRVLDEPISVKRLRLALGPARFPAPVGVQLMGRDPDALAETVRNAFEAGAPIVDLNFGCPSKNALRGCAGSALLDEPDRVGAIVAACARASPGSPVSAKIRAGGEDTELLEDLCHAAREGGAALLTVHCRTRREGYCEEVDWARIARAVDAAQIPVCGNGGVRTHDDLERMRRETGCAYVMVGRAALGDPWIFSGREVDSAEAAAFLVEYAEVLRARNGCRAEGAAARVKQLLRHWRAGGLGAGEIPSWLRIRDPEQLLEILGARADVRPAPADAPPLYSRAPH